MKRRQRLMALGLSMSFAAACKHSAPADGGPVASAAWVASASATVQPPAASLSSQPAPGFYRAKLGAFEVVALSDGVTSRQLDKILSDPQLTRDTLSAAHESQPTPVSINAYLVNTGAHVVLVDVGAGGVFGPTSGLLLKNLAGAGYRPEQIDSILLTHIHGDHSGGLSIAGKRQFSNATVYVGKPDAAYWLSKDEEAKAPEAKRKTFEQSRETVNPYVDAHRLVEIQHDGEVIPGFTSERAPGHTPGHTVFLLESEGHQLLFWGDVIHAAELQFEHPLITVEYDVDPAAAASTRTRLFERAATTGVLVASDHVSFPGFGHVARAGVGYRWFPLAYNSAVFELDAR